MKQKERQLRGSVLVFTMLVLAMLLSIAISSTSIVILGKNSSRATEKSAVSFQVADGAVENVLKRIYKNNDNTLQQLARNLYKENGVDDPRCDNGVITGELPSGSGAYSILFLDTAGDPMRCSGAGYNSYDEWRSKLARVVSSGSYGGATRAIDVAIEPRPCGGTSTVTDADGNVYDTVEIGNQCWMQQNLRVGSYYPAARIGLESGKLCYMEDPNNCLSDGGLYTWDDAMGTRGEGRQGICPNNWHIPTDDEWYELENFVDPSILTRAELGYPEILPDDVGFRGTDVATKLMIGGTSGFEGRFPGEYVRPGNIWAKRSTFARWLSSTGGFDPWPTTPVPTRVSDTSANASKMGRERINAFAVYSVRCLKD